MWHSRLRRLLALLFAAAILTMWFRFNRFEVYHPSLIETRIVQGVDPPAGPVGEPRTPKRR